VGTPVLKLAESEVGLNT